MRRSRNALLPCELTICFDVTGVSAGAISFFASREESGLKCVVSS